MSDAPLADAPTGTLMAGKRGLVMGVANDRSIAWGIARALAAQGAELAFTYQGEALEKRVRPLAASRSAASSCCPATSPTTPASTPSSPPSKEAWGGLDFLVHAIAFSDKDELKGRYLDTTRENFLQHAGHLLLFVHRGRQRAVPLMSRRRQPADADLLGAERVMPHYNVMGVAKAALEASVRYLAADLGEQRHPRQRDLGRADQDAGGERHRRLPLHPEVERVQLAAAAQRHHRGGRRRRALPAERPVVRRHRRGPSRRLRLPHRRHEGGRMRRDISTV